MTTKKLTNRLEAVFTLIPKAKAIADIGTDHGYLAVELIQRRRAERVIAGDVHKGPLESAKAYVKEQGLTQVVDCRLGDGLQVTQTGELQGAVICGMGGFLMRDIIEVGPELLDFYVLQPQNGQAELRQFLVKKGYIIAKEILVEDMGKLYQALLAIKLERLPQYVNHIELGMENVYANLSSDSLLWSVGALLAQERPSLWGKYIERLIHLRRTALQSMSVELANTEKYKMLEKEIAELEALL
ncbi:tRNA (adenine(22)-N(1))-methyltransferase [Veillonella intestinalis]|uniref:tRNA (adenine(22)-N(1))-methyltransferase n=1 Tax=Veillonella intestinalis TaxID=2941341 RepID=UPI0020416261|nr:class I SAM-dependent methyltransferase [Veillonella intestinalis]